MSGNTVRESTANSVREEAKNYDIVSVRSIRILLLALACFFGLLLWFSLLVLPDVVPQYSHFVVFVLVEIETKLLSETNLQ